MMNVVLLGVPCTPTNILYHALAAEFSVKVILERPIPRSAFLRRRVERLGALTVAGQLLFRALIVPYLGLRARSRLAEIEREHGLDPSPIPESEILRVEDANREAGALLRELAPDAVVVNGTRLLTRELIGAVPAPFVNVHAGITPLYRGVHGAYWALARDDRANCGVTVHLVDEGLDTGGILAQATIEPAPADSFVTYQHLQLAAALPLLRELLRRRSFEPRPPPAGESSSWSHPTLAGYARGRLRGVR